ncbi:dihydrofolate reductase [Python bivittatus]|uniref:Dihydrofolate reductase n=1 Tax=Python bivittatus TaxID=176946 RepID=A0A9F2R9F4_PYTBI|nr:dihydrofolate reductase [Python bivittatus]
MSPLRRTAHAARGALRAHSCRRLLRLFLPAVAEARTSGHGSAPTSPVSETDPTIMAAGTTRPSLRTGGASLCVCSAGSRGPKSSERVGSSVQNCRGEKRAMVASLHSIVAVCNNMGIGKDGKLPWPPLRNEFKHFQKMTMTTKEEGKQNVVIMGKKTWFSIPEKHRPLKNRINVVLSKELKDVPEGAHYLAKSLEEALDLLETSEMERKVDKVWIVGGSSVYKAAMEKPIHHQLFVTRIMHDFESDTFFPEIDLKKYKLLPNYTGIPTDIQEENGIQYKFEVYENTI